MNNWNSIKGYFNLDRFLEDKGIKSYYDDLPAKVKKSRVYFGRFKRNSGQQLDTDVLDGQDLGMSMISMGSSVVLPTSMFWDDLVGVVFTTKSFDEELPDEDMLSESKLPPSIKLDTFYLFKWEDHGDTSPAIQEYNAK